jgi:RNA polymerase sigma factor (sigma-70 family)
MDDLRWLAEYVDSGSQAAFEQLVNRHINLVYSAALRQVKNRDLADDIVQAVFIALATRAPTLGHESALAPWLLVTTRYIALDALRAQTRRQRHETKAAEMAQQTSRQSDDECLWEKVAPHLDAALASLNVHDRTAVTLRYFQQMSLKEVAEATGISADAARQRLHRATVRLRAFFVRRGVTIPLASIGPVIAEHAIHCAPSGLAAATASAALGGKPAAAGAAGLAKSFLNSWKAKVLLMAMTKTKLIAAAAAVLILSGGAVVGYRAMKPPVRQTVVLAPNVKIINPAAPAWKKRFLQTYSLAGGQMVKHVAPPMIPERQDYFDSLNQGAHYPLPPGGRVVFSANGDDLRWVAMSGGPIGFQLVLVQGARLKLWQIDQSIRDKINPSFDGDWVVRQGATTEQVMDGLGKLVSEQFGRPVQFLKKKVVNQTITARGSFHFVPLSGHADDGIIELDGGHNEHDNFPVYARRMSLTELLDLVEALTECKVVDETGAGKSSFQVRDHQVYRDTDLLIRNISAQTSIRFDRESREIEVWYLQDSTKPATEPSK